MSTHNTTISIVLHINPFLRYTVCMRKVRILLFLGLWVAILPYLGFPYSWKDIIMTISGVCLIVLSYLLYRESLNNKNKEEIFENFSENNIFEESKEEEIE